LRGDFQPAMTYRRLSSGRVWAKLFALIFSTLLFVLTMGLIGFALAVLTAGSSSIDVSFATLQERMVGVQRSNRVNYFGMIYLTLGVLIDYEYAETTPTSDTVLVRGETEIIDGYQSYWRAFSSLFLRGLLMPQFLFAQQLAACCGCFFNDFSGIPIGVNWRLGMVTPPDDHLGRIYTILVFQCLAFVLWLGMNNY
jgi:hypothetical protein